MSSRVNSRNSPPSWSPQRGRKRRTSRSSLTPRRSSRSHWPSALRDLLARQALSPGGRAISAPWLFLGAMLTNLKSFRPDRPESDHCGPRRALPRRVSDRRVFRRHTGSTPAAALLLPGRSGTKGQFRGVSLQRSAIASTDATICLARLPVEQVRRALGGKRSLRRGRILNAPPLAELARLDDASFRSLFAGGPIKRIGRACFVRNVMIAIGNSNDPAVRQGRGGPIGRRRLPCPRRSRMSGGATGASGGIFILRSRTLAKGDWT